MKMKRHTEFKMALLAESSGKLSCIYTNSNYRQLCTHREYKIDFLPILLEARLPMRHLKAFAVFFAAGLCQRARREAPRA